MPAPFRFDRHWTFPVAPADLWSTLARTDDYRDWWSWLRTLDSEGLREGASTRCVIQAPLPYALHFTVTVERLEPGRLVETRVSGDLDGPARLEISPNGHGTVARLAWALELRDPVLRRVSRVARPAMVWAHDRVVEMGARQFERRALGA